MRAVLRVQINKTDRGYGADDAGWTLSPRAGEDAPQSEVLMPE